MVKVAIRNYEIYHQLPKGSCKITHVKYSSLGLEGWAKYKPQPNE